MASMQALAMGSIGILMALFTSAAHAATTKCRYPQDTSAQTTLPGITWDLSKAALSSGWYGAYDASIRDTDKFYFTFNVCGDMQNQLPPNCTTANSDCPSHPNGNPAAWRYDSGTGECFCLGTFPHNAAKLQTYHVDIHDTTRPALGVDLIYKLGGSQKIDKCTSAGGVIGVTPNVTITLLCGNPRRHSTDKLEANKVNGMFVDATDECGYDIHAVSTLGCPEECPVNNDQVCSGNGHCAYDITSQKAHCFCDKNYNGNDCSNKVSDSHSSSAAVGAVFGGLFTGFIAVAGFWYYKHRWSSGDGGYENKDGEEGFY